MFFADVKKISKHYTIYALGGILSKAIGFVMIPVYTRHITPADYGVLGILSLFIWVVSLIFGMNMTTGVTRFYYIYKDTRERNSVVSSSMFFVALIFLPMSLCLFYFSDIISQLIFKNIQYSPYLKITFAALFFESLLPIPLTCFRIKNKSLLFMRFSLLQLFIGLSFNIIFIVAFKWGLRGIFYSQLFTNMIMAPILLYVTFKDFGFGFSWEPLKKTLSYALPLVPAGLAMLVLNLGDRYILKQFVPLADIGCYTIGYKIAMILGFLVGGPFRYVWQPYSFSIAEDTNAPQIYSRVFTYFTLFISFIGLGLAILAQDIVKIITTPVYFEAAKVIPIVVAGYIFYQLYYLVNIGMFIKKKTKWAAYIVTAAAIFNIILNFILIPKIGMMAAAYTTLASFVFLALLGYVFSQRFYKISYEFDRLLKIAMTALGLYFASKVVNIASLSMDIFVKSVLVLSFPFMLYLLGFYTPQEIARIPEIMETLKIKTKSIFLRIFRAAEGL